MRTAEYVIVFVVRPAVAGHELLMGLRAEGRYLGGTWQLVTGGIGPGETAWQAAVREVGEETGLPVRELYRLGPVTQFYRSDIDALCVAPVFCVVTDAAAEPTICPEHTSLAWVVLDAAGGRLFWQSDTDALEVVRRILNGHPSRAHLRIDFR